MSNILTPVQAAKLAKGAGFPDPVTFVAVMMAESGLDADQVSHNHNPPSRDRGLCQINDLAYPEVTDATAFDPAQAVHVAYLIWVDSGGTFGRWAAFTNGSYKQYLETAALAVDHMQADQQTGVQQMNQKMVDAANTAITDDRFTDVPGMCERFAREVIQSVYGPKYDDMYRASAEATGDAWLVAGFGVDTGDHQPGDVLFKTFFEPGHVGILVEGGRVAENSSTQFGRVSGAKGYRTLSQFGRFDVCIRLPDLVQYDKLYLNGQYLFKLPVENGHAFCPLREWAHALGFELGGSFKGGFTLQGNQIPKGAVLIGGHPYLPIRDLVQSAGLQLSVDGDLIKVSR